MRLLLLFVFFTCWQAAHAQIKPSRMWLVDMARRPTPTGAMPSMMGGAEIFRGWGSFEHEQAWQLRLHAVAEPFRFSSLNNDASDDTSGYASSDTETAWTTSLEFHHELTANPLNDIAFNPRTARWEEQLLVHAATASWSARAGWLHRCKHDIDNTDPPSEYDTTPYSPERRTLILSGPTIGAMTAPMVSNIGSMRFATGVEWYIINDDYRSPSNAEGSWRGLEGALWLHAEGKLNISKSFIIGTQYYISIPWFSSRYNSDASTIPLEFRAELYATLLSTAAALDVVVSVDHTFDEVAFLPGPQTRQIQIGLRFRSQ